MMCDCDRDGAQIECPEICVDEKPHQHWRCPEGHGWLMIPRDDGPDVPFFDLAQPARCIYPDYSRVRRVRS